MNSVSISLIKFMIMQQHVQLNQHHCKQKLAAACLESLICHYFKQFTGIGNKIHVSQNECAPVQTVVDFESHQLLKL